MNKSERYAVAPEDNGARLDAFIRAAQPEISRSQAQKLIDGRMVTVNGMMQSKNFKLKEGDIICVTLPKTAALDIAPENVALDIVYEDADVIVVNKPKGMVVHPAAGNYNGTLVNALIYHCGDTLSGINGVARPGIVHRIDKNTSGLLMVAKNDYAHNFLAHQIKEHSFLREYEAVVYGTLKDDEGAVNAPIGRHPVHRKKMAVTEKNSKTAVTHYRVIARYNGFTHIRVKLETGRTHQIRVHMAYIGHPVAGDELYGPAKAIKELQGQCLHARLLGFIHPSTREWLTFETQLPEYFTAFLSKINRG